MSTPSHPPLSAALFDLPDDLLWVLHCAEGPVPSAAARAVAAFLPRETQPWRLRWVEDYQGIPPRLRALVADFLGGVAVEDVSLTATTSSGLATVAQAYPWSAGDEVLLPLGEFPSNYWPWAALAHRGVKVRQVPLWDGHRAGQGAWISTPPAAASILAATPEQRLLDAITPATRIVAASWVRFQDGLQLDLETLGRGCAARGVDLVVDGIQGAGAQPAPLAGVSAFSTGGHKGLLAPQGLGFLYTAADFRKRLAPTGSWLSVADATDFSRPSTDFDRAFEDDGTRFEQGSINFMGCVALHAALDLLLAAGLERIAAHVSTLRRAFLAQLAGLPAWAAEADRLRALDDAARLGPIVALHHGGAGQDALQALLAAASKHKIYSSVREGYLRVAFHGWHRHSDLPRLRDWLAAGL